MTSIRIARGIPVTLADGTAIRVPTIPFTDEGLRIAALLDALSAPTLSNVEYMGALLDAAVSGIRLNHPDASVESLRPRLDLQAALDVIAALRGESPTETTIGPESL
ncbi:MAG: hypothetical protein WC712_05320 [Candidatus Brocadiia bacterium]